MNRNLQIYREKAAVIINEYVKKHGTDEVKHYTEIRKMLKDNIGTLNVMFQESDMCYDKTNRANLKSYPTDVLLFESVGKRGCYRILGEHYRYTGTVTWLRKGKDTPDVVVGKWTDGTLDYWGDSIVTDNTRTNNIDKKKSEEIPEKMEPAEGIHAPGNSEKGTFNIEAIRLLDDFMKGSGIVDIKNEKNPVIERSRGKAFSFHEHLRGLIYALLTNQRKWSDVEPKLPQIDKLFFDYDVEEIGKHDGTYFENGIRNLRCGNISIKTQMAGLHHNIAVLEDIEKAYGSLDSFVTSEAAESIVKKLSNSGSKYKINGLGVALAWEYLRNVGIDGGKPDTHLKRFFGNERIGISASSMASEDEVINIIEQLSKAEVYNRFEIDYLIWAYCASGKGEICSVNPRCSQCVIRDYCRKG